MSQTKTLCSRSRNSEDPVVFDLCIVGGGINGCGIARDAAGRGYSVCLCEASDLGSATSSASTKLVHGGLRYLEYYQFSLVRKALKEREVLWKIAPHIVRPLRFVLPYHKGLRPAWLLRLGLFIYDHIGGRKLLPPTRVLSLSADETGLPLKAAFERAFEYSDCWVDDSRLVVLNARDAADRGASIRTRTKVTKVKRQAGLWQIKTENADTSRAEEICAKVLINATGPWVDEFLRKGLGRNDAQNVRLVRGSHIVVNKIYEHDRCYIFQSAGGRIIFAIPYERDYTLIGTTDQDHQDPLGNVAASGEEIAYLCRAANDYFRKSIAPEDVIWTYSGVRPLFDDKASKAHETTRDFVISKDGSAETGVMINIFGGKITTFRKLAESVVEMVEQTLGAKDAPWTANAALPGGDFEATAFDALFQRYRSSYPFIEESHMDRLLRAYGTQAETILGSARSIEGLGKHFGADLYETEVRHLIDREWARDADDILFRRTKLGIRMSKVERQALDRFMAGECQVDNREGPTAVMP